PAATAARPAPRAHPARARRPRVDLALGRLAVPAPQRRSRRPRRTRAGPLMALLALVLLAICLAEYLRRVDTWQVMLAQVVVLVGIVVAAAHALGHGPIGWLPVIVGLWWGVARTLPSWRVPGMIASGLAGGLALVVSPFVDRDHPPMLDWYEDLGVPGLLGVGLDEFVLAVVTVVALIGPANAVVREVLDHVGRGLLREEMRLKGGRIIGPLERVM